MRLHIFQRVGVMGNGTERAAVQTRDHKQIFRQLVVGTEQHRVVFVWIHPDD